MLISDFAIKRPLITVVSMLGLVVFGLFALFRLKTDEFPDVQPPIVATTVIYPGASPDQVEREILEPIEEAIQGIQGVDFVQGEARDGYASIITWFVFEKNIQEAQQDIRDAISLKRQDLPQEMEEPILKKLSDTDRPVMSITLSSTSLSPAQLTRLADPGITREFRSLGGVADVSVKGEVKRELTVELRPQALLANGVGVAQVVQALQSQNLAAPVGRIEGTLEEKTIRLQGRLEDAQEFTNLVVTTRNGIPIRLGQLANVRDGTEEPRTLALYNGKEAVGIDIKKAKEASTTDLSLRLNARLDEIRKTLPPGVTLNVIRDAGVRVDRSVKNVQETLLEGALLTVLVVFIFLNSWRSTVITGLALPVSVLASFVAVWAFGFTLNTMSLLGLSLAIGILIDDAIVVRENIVRHVEMGKDHYTAAREGTDEIGLAVAATTFSIVAVFVPIAFVSGLSGQWFKPFALTIACSVLVSLFVSFSLDPMLSAYWPDPHVPEDRKNFITKGLDKFNKWFNDLAHGYRGVIAWALDHRLAMVGLALLTFVGALSLPVLGLVGTGLVPEDDRSEFNLSIETPPGANLDYTRLKSEEAARLVRAHKEVLYTYTTIGGASGAVDEANIFVKTTPKADRSISVTQLAAKLREEVRGIGGAKVSVFSSDFGGGRKEIQLQLQGNNAAELAQYANAVLEKVRQVKGAVDIGLSTKGQKPELNVELNRGLAGSLGMSVGQVAQSLRPAFAGIKTGDWVDPSGETREVRVRLDPEARRRGTDLEQMPLVLNAPGGAPTTVPLGQIASVKQTLGPAIINHLDRDKVIIIQANTSGRSLGQVNTDIAAIIKALPKPASVKVSNGGQAKDQKEIFTNILAALGVAVMLMYFILVVQFGSFIDPLAILISLPLSLIGVMLALMLGGKTINIMSMIGVILLAGIVAKNAILLIDFAKWAREKQGMPLREALIEAGAIRLRPILMTTFALIAGMIPVALGSGEGSQFRAPLGLAVIGGTITSTLLTLVVIPTFYEIMDEWRAAVARRFGMKVAHTGEHRAVGSLAPVAGD
ncbi:MAG: efflux RND transporter permease subunit [Gemmatimonadetes bacterium]|nr:efflux RND transporter permease subunit [Gemmatimonadota bacterium]